jgi:ATP-dependent Clp protease ATP-binding subunit ClpC
MLERFTDRARQVIVLAQQQARALDHDSIGTEHILLGLIGEGQGVAVKALTSLGISLDEIRQAVEAVIGRGTSQRPMTGHIPFTPQAKKVLELSLREAHLLGADYIGTEHILLGLVREGDGVAAQVLIGAGVDLDRARRQVTELLHGRREASAAVAPAPVAADELIGRLTSIVTRLDAIERRLRQSAQG